jgi:hypothetical protein
LIEQFSIDLPRIHSWDDWRKLETTMINKVESNSVILLLVSALFQFCCWCEGFDAPMMLKLMGSVQSDFDDSNLGADWSADQTLMHRPSFLNLHESSRRKLQGFFKNIPTLP